LPRQLFLELPGSGAILADLARSNLLLVPLDRRGQWYRYHYLFRDMLLAELERLEPELISALRRRAAAWYLQNDLPEDALEYFMAARDVDAAASLVEQLWLVTYRQGRGVTALRWLRWLEDRGGIEGHPMLAVGASVVFVNIGHPVEAERWADALDRSQDRDPARLHDPATAAWVAAVRAFFCRQGVEQMRANADEAVRRSVEAGIASPAAVWPKGSPGSLAVIWLVETPSWPRRQPRGKQTGQSKLSLIRSASDHCWPWHAVTGARPRPWWKKHIARCARLGLQTPSSPRY